MRSNNRHLQLLYREIYDEIESLEDKPVSKKKIEAVMEKILKLDKKNKQQVLFNKLQSNTNFLTVFNELLEDEIQSLINY